MVPEYCTESFSALSKNEKKLICQNCITIIVIQTGVYNKRMCFYVPEKFQANPPKPTNKDVSIETIGYDDVIVKRFGGYVMNDALWVNHAQRFR